MNGPSLCIIAALIITFSTARSQEAPDLKALLASYQEKVELEAVRPYELGVANLNEKYLAALLPMQEAAQKSGKLEQAIALKQERERVLAGQTVPDQDEAGTIDALKKMRATYRTALARLDLNRDKIIRPMKEAFYKQLDSVALSLTKAGKLDEASEARQMQQSLLAVKEPVGKTAGGDSDNQALLNATSESPYENSLGMKFVTFDCDDKKLLICIWSARVSDYAAYAKATKTPEGKWQNGAENTQVQWVSLTDAQSFCEWLTKQELKANLIKKPFVIAFQLPRNGNVLKRTLREMLNQPGTGVLKRTKIHPTKCAP